MLRLQSILGCCRIASQTTGRRSQPSTRTSAFGLFSLWSAVQGSLGTIVAGPVAVFEARNCPSVRNALWLTIVEARSCFIRL